MKRNNKKEQTISGIVLPDRWDDLDNVIGVAIETAEGEEYIVEANERSNQLLHFLDEEVQATGIIRERLDGDLTISVKRFEAFDTPREVDFDENYYSEEEEDWQ
jgi:hypothetical protein